MLNKCNYGMSYKCNCGMSYVFEKYNTRMKDYEKFKTNMEKNNVSI